MNKKSLDFHIKSQDYFGTLATVLSLLQQKEFTKETSEVIKEKIEELMYLQENYKIIKKDGSKSSNKEYR